MPAVRAATYRVPVRYRGQPYEEVLHQGQRFYRFEQFKLALEAFEAARFMIKGEILPLELLDHLAATNEKLGRFGAALEESKLLIKNYGTSSRGYLRAGRIFFSLGSLTESAAIYRLGLRSVSNEDPNFKILREKLIALPDPTKFKDPLDVFPPEIAVMVFREFDFVSLVSVLRVSKRWSRFLRSQGSLWENLDFLPVRKPLQRAVILSGLHIAHATVKQIRLRDLGMDGSTFRLVASTIITRCPRLEQLELYDSEIKIYGLLKIISATSSLKQLKLSCEVGLQDVAMLLRKVKLVKARFEQVLSAPRHRVGWEIAENLESLHLGLAQDERPIDFRNMHEIMPNLKQLSLLNWGGLDYDTEDFSSFSHLTSLSLVACQMDIWPKLPSTLSYLFLGSVKFMFMAHPESQQNIACSDLPCLRALHLSRLYDLTFSDLNRLVARSSANGNLEEVELHDCIISKRHTMKTVASGLLKSVWRIAISNSDSVDDELAESIATLPNLTSLDLSHNAKITGVGVKKLVLKEGRKLDLLTINSCPKVGRDAVEYARKIIRRVDFIPEGDLLGRNIRYG